MWTNGTLKCNSYVVTLTIISDEDNKLISHDSTSHNLLHVMLTCGILSLTTGSTVIITVIIIKNLRDFSDTGKPQLLANLKLLASAVA